MYGGEEGMRTGFGRETWETEKHLDDLGIGSAIILK